MPFIIHNNEWEIITHLIFLAKDSNANYTMVKQSVAHLKLGESNC